MNGSSWTARLVHYYQNQKMFFRNIGFFFLLIFSFCPTPSTQHPVVYTKNIGKTTTTTGEKIYLPTIIWPGQSERITLNEKDILCAICWQRSRIGCLHCTFYEINAVASLSNDRFKNIWFRCVFLILFHCWWNLVAANATSKEKMCTKKHYFSPPPSHPNNRPKKYMMKWKNGDNAKSDIQWID